MFTKQHTKSRLIAGTALFSALVAAVEYLSLAVPILRIPFPLNPILKFDMAEIPAALSYFVFGLPVGVATSLLVPLTIIARGTTNPVGAWIKGFAVLSTVVGFAPFAKRNKFLAAFTAIISRVLVMTLANIAMFGTDLWVLLLSGVFNLIHTVLTIGGATILFEAIVLRIPQLRLKEKLLNKT